MTVVLLCCRYIPKMAQFQDGTIGKHPRRIAFIVRRVDPREDLRASRLDVFKLFEAPAEKHSLCILSVARGVLQPFANSSVSFATAASATEENLRERAGQ